MPKKSEKNRSAVELWRESAYDSDGIELHTGLYGPGLRYMEIHIRGNSIGTDRTGRTGPDDDDDDDDDDTL